MSRNKKMKDVVLQVHLYSKGWKKEKKMKGQFREEEDRRPKRKGRYASKTGGITNPIDTDLKWWQQERLEDITRALTYAFSMTSEGDYWTYITALEDAAEGY